MTNRIKVSGYDLLFPMDVDKKSIHAVIMEQDRILCKKTFPYDGENILRYTERKYPGKRILFAYEAGPTGYGLYDFLKGQGKDCEVAVPSMIPRAPGQRVKTNHLDAVRLGHQMKSGEMQYVQVADKEYRDLRQLVRLRWQYGKKLVGTMHRLKALFLFYGIKFPEGKWSSRLIQEIKEGNYQAAMSFKVRQLLKDYGYYRKEGLMSVVEIRKFCRENEEIWSNVGYLKSIYGVGWIVSTYFLSAIGGPKNLNNTRSTCHLFGLGPREHSTSDRTRRGCITGIGDPIARKMIIQAAWIAIRKNDELRKFFWDVYFRNPKQYAKQKAIIAVARKLVCRMHAVLRDQRNYEIRNDLEKTA